MNGFHVGPLFVHFYALMYIVGISLAVLVGRRRWSAAGGDPAMVEEIALWGVPFGILGGRLYFDLTTPSQIPPHWWGPLAVWDGGLGIWGGVALATAVCVWRLRKAGTSVTGMMDALAPSLLIASGIGRIGNYFNQELFGGPTHLPWALQIAPQFRPPGYLQDTTFHPTFLYELIWDLLLAAVLVWLGHHRKLAPGSLFALYIAGYSTFRMFEESLRVDYSQHFLGLRLNFYVAAALTLGALIWLTLLQRHQHTTPTEPQPEPDEAPDSAGDDPDDDDPEPPRSSAPAAEHPRD
ncbi:prolipoprotein diacylglyceryl transferase [Streptacidiphilus sp. P02-A3a]|uniref:prolipoprotein diacylglyceryl transferase n=1 Tax=Streptacidiphilus sp. P02-A3a TaxID=2704468 RepID=UPI0015FA686A|nr:prolipoprotein diacylglyceryl transferase [Streptacidiphilus sp. P02-A3a]QMU70019.1 prolipoprotein diacylglyceryl transferase [Streptacidiphilus sp. P02-A3a]